MTYVDDNPPSPTFKSKPRPIPMNNIEIGNCSNPDNAISKANAIDFRRTLGEQSAEIIANNNLYDLSNVLEKRYAKATETPKTKQEIKEELKREIQDLKEDLEIAKLKKEVEDLKRQLSDSYRNSYPKYTLKDDTDLDSAWRPGITRVDTSSPLPHWACRPTTVDMTYAVCNYK